MKQEMVNLREIEERFLRASAEQRPMALKELIKGLRSVVQAGDHAEAARGLRTALLPDLDFSSAQSLYRFYQGLGSARDGSMPRVRLAVLGGYTTSSLAQLIELYLFSFGVQVEIYEGAHGTFRQEILESNSGLYLFAPKIVLIVSGWRDIANMPLLNADATQVDECCCTELQQWRQLWNTLHDRLGCAVVQSNFDVPPWRTLGNHDSRQPAGLSHYLACLNLAFQEEAPPYVTIHDVDGLAALWGRWNWSDPRFYHYGKLPCAPAYLVNYAHSVASLIAAQLGRSKKCLVLDLDNTLWGGVVGDDGLDGVRLGQGDPESEAFVALQQYVKALRDRGIVLAVCSNNDETIAREAVEKHPAMVLRTSDFACFVANRNDKANNLRSIARQLNLGLDSLVFVDDNPAERALVRQLLPEVAVPEMTDDPADYIQTLESHRYFQVIGVSVEDLKRADYYRAEVARASMASSTDSLEDYLVSLQMKARVEPIHAGTLTRSAQLIERTNQFNLTTRRHSAAEIQARIGRDNWVSLTVSLSDRFGDNGLISVLLAEIRGEELHVDTWVMSCRVLSRTVEHLLLNNLYELARIKGVRLIHGEYIPTPKNPLVKNHYRNMGFECIGTEADGTTRWRLVVKGDRPVLRSFVQKESI